MAARADDSEAGLAGAEEGFSILVLLVVLVSIQVPVLCIAKQGSADVCSRECHDMRPAHCAGTVYSLPLS